MERYRLIPHKTGIAISVPHVHGDLVARVTRKTPIVTLLERRCGGECRFVDNEQRWGLEGELGKEEGRNETIYVANLVTPKSPTHLSRSLHLLSLALSPLDVLSDKDPEAPLVHLSDLLSSTGSSGHDMGAELSPRMVELLTRFNPRHHRRIEAAMKRAAEAMGWEQTYPYTCNTNMGLALVVPGEETWLACDEYPSPERVTQMGGHNIDHARQQFALLAGLAEAHAIAEEIDASS